MDKKEYIKPTIERRAIFTPQGQYMGLSAKNVQPLLLNKTNPD